MQYKSFEERVIRMEYYLSLMRDMVIDPEAYALWDYIMSEELNEEQANRMISLLRKYHAQLQLGEVELNKFVESALYLDLKHLLDSFGKPANEKAAYSIIIRASKLPIFPHYAVLLQNSKKEE
ncbi:DUF1878 family protein [Paenibacillus sp. Z6-24]